VPEQAVDQWLQQSARFGDGVIHREFGPFSRSIQHAWHNAAMAHPRKSRECGSTDGALSGGRLDEPPSTEPIDPRAFGFTKAAYAVGEALDLLSIGRTALYAAVKRGDLKRVKFGKKMLFYAADLVSFLTRFRR
jgi:excisionase family DNA binding protein